MKKNNNSLLIIVALILVALSVILWGCSENDSQSANNLSPEDFVSLDNFTLKTNTKENSTIKYINDGGRITYSTTYSTKDVTNTLYYVFESGMAKEYSAGKWTEIASEDINSYINSINNACGLIYNKIDLSYFKELQDKKFNFTIQSDVFFKQAYRQIYQTYFGENYDEQAFTEDFEQNSATLFGDVKNYEITLDCSQNEKIILNIKNLSSGNTNIYEYYDIDKTVIDLPL